jgi:hypothetical protein
MATIISPYTANWKIKRVKKSCLMGNAGQFNGSFPIFGALHGGYNIFFPTVSMGLQKLSLFLNIFIYRK